jgi:hypothetical protein
LPDFLHVAGSEKFLGRADAHRLLFLEGEILLVELRKIAKKSERNVNTGGLLLYDIANNQITGAFFLGNVGLDWRYAGIAPIEGPGTSDLVLRNVNTGACQVYTIAGNTLVGSASLGAAGLDWQLGGFAGYSASGATGSSDNLTAQLVQAMAGFGGGSGAADGLNAAFANAQPSQQPLLTIPQHA